MAKASEVRYRMERVAVFVVGGVAQRSFIDVGAARYIEVMGSNVSGGMTGDEIEIRFGKNGGWLKCSVGMRIWLPVDISHIEFQRVVTGGANPFYVDLFISYDPELIVEYKTNNGIPANDPNIVLTNS